MYGTHYDHRGKRARLEASRMILAHAGDQERVLVMGDLNAAPGDPEVAAFVEASYRDAVPDQVDRGYPTGTFNGFRDPLGGTRRIDHVLVHGPISPVRVRVLGKHSSNRFPSDHFAVAGTVKLR